VPTYHPHPCALPGCNVITTNKECCCKEHSHSLMASRRQDNRETETRTCSACGESKPLSEFKRYDRHGKLYTVSRCTACTDAGFFGDTKRSAEARARNAAQRPNLRGHLDGHLGTPFEGAGALVDPWGPPAGKRAPLAAA
jgi:hypothetical protein